jgi:hypothetical protein
MHNGRTKSAHGCCFKRHAGTEEIGFHAEESSLIVREPLRDHVNPAHFFLRIPMPSSKPLDDKRSRF